MPTRLDAQLLAGAPDDTLQALGLTRTGPYRLLGNGQHPFARVGAAAADGADATTEGEGVRVELASEFEATSAAMAALHVGGDEALRLLAGLLHLGSLTFEDATATDSAAAGSNLRASAVAPASAEALQHASALLGMPTLASLLTKRSVQAGGG